MKKGNGESIWALKEINDLGMFRQYAHGNGLLTNLDYDSYYLPQSIRVSGKGIKMNQSYVFQPNGNLQSRSWADNILSKDNKQTENFSYDNNRLKEYKGGNVSYHINGNIETKTGVGRYIYPSWEGDKPNGFSSPGGPHAVASILQASNETYKPKAESITYTAFNKIESLAHKNGGREESKANFYYGTNQQRNRVEYFIGDRSFTRYYVGGLVEEDYEASKLKERVSYIFAGQGLAALYVVSENQEGKMFYVHKDYQGNILALTDDQGKVAQHKLEYQIFSYDPWGKRRNPANWEEPDNRKEFLTDRGYTGHEHLDDFSLINMNGRVYDPVLGRFLSPDSYVQMPDFTQNFNRYAYCLNNPLIYTDPSGELIFGFLRGVYDAATSGALEFWNWNDDYTHEAWSKADPTLAGTAGNNSYRLWEAYLTTENFWRQLPQNTIGFLTAQGLNTFLDVEYVDNKYGASVVSSKYIDGGAFTMGSFIMGPEGMRADYHDHLFVHEYGHVLQSRKIGLCYLPFVAISSLASYKWDKRKKTKLHDTRWFETDASRRAADYFTALPDSDFERENFITGKKSTYENPRLSKKYGYKVYNFEAHPINSKFHRSDLFINMPGLNVFLIFSL